MQGDTNYAFGQGTRKTKKVEVVAHLVCLLLLFLRNRHRLPDLKIVITGTQYGYRREDGVFVIPLGCLKD